LLLVDARRALLAALPDRAADDGANVADGRTTTLPALRDRRPSPVLLIIGAITLLGLLLRLPSFDDSLFGDEVSTYFIVTDNYFVPGDGLDRVIDIVRSPQEITPPLYFVLAWAVQGIGDPAQSLKLVSLAAGVAAIPLTYLLGLWTVGRRAALLGALLMALSPFLIFYSTEARGYALMLLLALLSTLALLRALDTSRTRWWVVYAAFSCAAMYTHYTAIFVLAGQLGWAFWTRSEAREALVIANGAAVLAYLPWLPGYLEDRDAPANVIAILHPFTLDAVGTDLVQWLMGGSVIPPSELPGRLAIAVAGAGLATGALGALIALIRAPGQGAAWRPPARLVLVVMLAFATPVGAALYSLIGDSVWTSKNLIASWPGLALAIGALLASAPGLLRIGAVGLVLAGLAIGSVRMLDSANQRPNYEGAAAFIEETGKPGDPVLEFPFGANPVTPLEVALADGGDGAPQRHHVLRVATPTHAAQRRARAEGLPPATPLPTRSVEVVGRRAGRLGRGGGLFVVAPSFSRVGVSTRPFLDAVPSRFREVERRTFPGFFPVSVYVFRDTQGRRRGKPG
jgi:mannosyltransferase